MSCCRPAAWRRWRPPRGPSPSTPTCRSRRASPTSARRLSRPRRACTRRRSRAGPTRTRAWIPPRSATASTFWSASWPGAATCWRRRPSSAWTSHPSWPPRGWTRSKRPSTGATRTRPGPEAWGRGAPAGVGNRQHVLVSELAGRSNVLAKAAELGLDLSPELATEVLDQIKAAEHRGYAYEAADASFELLVRKIAGALPGWFSLDSYRVMIERSQAEDRSEAIVRLRLGSERGVAVGEGVGPVHALDQALRRALSDFYPALSGIHLVDYKVRILDGRAATSAVTRVMLTSADQIGEWTTVGVSDDIVTASWEALADGLAFALLRAGADPPPTSPALFADAPQDIPLDLETLPEKV